MDTLLAVIKVYMGDKPYTLYSKDNSPAFDFDTVSINGTKITFPIDPTTTFREFKKIYTKLWERTDDSCIICSEQVIMLIPCNACEFTMCPTCYIHIIKNNQGISKCPHCRAETGEVLSDQILHKYITYINNEIIKQIGQICKVRGVCI